MSSPLRGPSSMAISNIIAGVLWMPFQGLRAFFFCRQRDPDSGGWHVNGYRLELCRQTAATEVGRFVAPCRPAITGVPGCIPGRLCRHRHICRERGIYLPSRAGSPLQISSFRPLHVARFQRMESKSPHTRWTSALSILA